MKVNVSIAEISIHWAGNQYEKQMTKAPPVHDYDRLYSWYTQWGGLWINLKTGQDITKIAFSQFYPYQMSCYTYHRTCPRYLPKEYSSQV